VGREKIKEFSGLVTIKGKPLTLVGNEVEVGDVAPDFEAVDNDLKGMRLSDFKGRTVILCSVPSLETPVCDTEMRKFNQEAGTLGVDVKVLTISMDLPFAQKRWCGTAGVKNVQTLSDHCKASFGIAYGVLIKELRLLARAVFVIDEQGIVRYKQIVGEIASEPDYEAAFKSAKGLIVTMDQISKEVMNKMSYEKEISIEYISDLLASLCVAEGNYEDAPKPFELLPLHKEIVTSEFIDRDYFITEAIFLAYFAVDYSTADVLGQDNPDRKAILHACSYKIMQRLGSDVGHIFANGLNERLAIYSIAYHEALRHTDKPEAVPFLIGETFSRLNEGRTTDHELSIKAGVHFCMIIDAVIKFLKPIRDN
jgi:thiol peroxidase